MQTVHTAAITAILTALICMVIGLSREIVREDRFDTAVQGRICQDRITKIVTTNEKVRIEFNKCQEAGNIPVWVQAVDRSMEGLRCLPTSNPKPIEKENQENE